MAQAQQGNVVQVHYTGTLQDGTQFDSSRGREPIQFTVGGGQMIPGFDKGVEGMSVGDTKTITIPPEEAYGEHSDEMVLKAPRDQFPPDIEPEVGMQLELRQPDNQVVGVVITEVNDSEVTLDANHPLAGETLIFDVELMSVS